MPESTCCTPGCDALIRCSGLCARCYGREKSRRLRAQKKKPAEIIQCRVCGADFERASAVSAYCGRPCRVKAIAINAKRKRRTGYSATCEHCTADIPNPSRAVRYCGPRCMQRAHYLANQEAIKARTRDWAARHPDVKRVRDQVYRNGRREQLTILRLRRRERQLRATSGPALLAADWQRLLNRSGGRCTYCGNRARLEMDHVIPLARGGMHVVGNVLPVCKSCNCSKGSKLLAEWRYRIPRGRRAFAGTTSP